MEIRHILEAASLASTEPKEDGSWAVRLISEGKGSSGVYTRELLENYHHAFDDVLSFLNHPSGSPTDRNFTEIAGRIKKGSVKFVEEAGVGAIYGDYLPDPQYADKLERYKDKLGLSIYISGSGYVEESSGDFIVESFDAEDPFRSVDIVHAPGARGRFLESMKEVYSDRVSEDKEPTTTAVEDERNKLMEMEEKVDKALAILASLVADKAEKAAEAAQVTADAEAAKIAAEQAVSAYAAAVEAVDAAELFESQRKSILATAITGADVSELIESAKTVREEAIKSVSESKTQVEGRVLGSESKQFSLTQIAGK